MKDPRMTRPCTRQTTKRRGAAVVEMAIVTPLLLTMLFGIIEFSWMMSVQQTLTNAAREGCRTATIRGTSDQDVTDRVDAYMAPAGLTGYGLDIVRGTTGNPTEVVTVSINYGDISLVGGYFPGLESKTLTSTCSMRTEGS